MTMTHKEALRVARIHLWGEANDVCEDVTLTDFLRAYIEARGLALVPKEATGEQMAASGLAGRRRAYRAMLAAAPDPFMEEVA